MPCAMPSTLVPTSTRQTALGAQSSPAPSQPIGMSPHRTLPASPHLPLRWETVDASDASFMSEDRLNVLRIALLHPDISLYTLNAPQDSINDVTPLGMAAWLDMPHVVRLLLECSAGSVSVDGTDTDGATPLMCKSTYRVPRNTDVDSCHRRCP